MSTDKPNIEQTRKYLNGELDARAMFELERQAEQDPFLWDVIRGMESSDTDHEPNLAAIDNLITKRVEQDRRKVVPMWKYLSVAASLLIVLSIGGWWLTHQQVTSTIIANNEKAVSPDKAEVRGTAIDTQRILPIGKKPLSAKLKHEKLYDPGKNNESENVASGLLADKKISTDTVTYQASAYPVKAKASVNELLKKLPGVDVDANGNVIAQGQQVTKVRINGKGFNGGDAKTAVKKMPADVIEKIQIIDDYGDQAAKTGIKTGEPDKVLNILSKSATTNTALDYKISIRGAATPSPGKPLYVVDGIIVSDTAFKKIAQQEIKNINILKDGTATAIYGARASQGVVVVNTKKADRMLNEVAIVGYGTQKKTVVTGAVSSISVNPTVEAKRADTNINDALNARLAGIQFKGKDRANNNGSIITGKVVDQNKTPIPGASIRLEGTKVTSQTDIDGVFRITVPGENATLYVSFIGYEAKQIKVKDKENLNIALKVNSSTLSEVVVTGYGRDKKEDVIEDAKPANGWKAYNQYLKESAISYSGKTGIVKLSFTVERSGVISNIRILKSLDADLDKRAIELIQNGSGWLPESDGKVQQVKIRIRFRKPDKPKTK